MTTIKSVPIKASLIPTFILLSNPIRPPIAAPAIDKATAYNTMLNNLPTGIGLIIAKI